MSPLRPTHQPPQLNPKVSLPADTPAPIHMPERIFIPAQPAEPARPDWNVRVALWVIAGLLALIFLSTHGWAQTNVQPSGVYVRDSTGLHWIPVGFNAADSALPVNCVTGCAGGGSTTANQGTPNTLANGWPVELTDGINVLGVALHPLRVDPTGTTPQPVTGTFFQATQPVSCANAATCPVNASQVGIWQVSPTGAANTIANAFFHQISDGTNAMGAMNVFGTTPGAVRSLNVNASLFQGTTAVGTGAPLQVSLANTGANATAVKVDGSGVTQPVSIAAAVTANPTPTTSSAQAVSPCNILTTASTNATNCKNAAGNFFGYEIFNTTTTVYYLRLYNTSSAPTCSSATGFIRSIPIPPGAGSGLVAGAVSNQFYPTNYGTGISYCVTGGSASTDNTNAAAGLFGEIRYD